MYPRKPGKNSMAVLCAYSSFCSWRAAMMERRTKRRERSPCFLVSLRGKDAALAPGCFKDDIRGLSPNPSNRQ